MTAFSRIAVLLAAMAAAASGFGGEPGGTPRTLHVDAAAGDDARDGLTPETALRSLQAAADRVRPGDRVRVAPGVYFERPRLARYGTAGRPIRFEAADNAPGKTVVTAADPAFRRQQAAWTLEDEALSLYSAPFTHVPARILYSGYDLFPYSSFDGLKTFTLADGYPAPHSGFFYQAGEKKLYVRLRADGEYGPSDPSRHVFAVAPENAGGSAGHHVWKPEHAVFYLPGPGPCHITLDGFTLETPGAAGVVTYADGLVVRNVTFQGCRFGVAGVARRNGTPPSGLFIEHCDYSSPNIFREAMEVVERYRSAEAEAGSRYYWWHRKGVKCDPAFMKTYETGIAHGDGANWHIRDNTLHGMFEGMACWGMNRSRDAQIYGNSFRRLVDNAVEAENHNTGMRISFNHFEDVFEPFSVQPLAGLPWPGPVFIYRNLVADTPEMAGRWPSADTHQRGIFKLGAAKRNWEVNAAMGPPAAPGDIPRTSDKVFALPDPGMLVFNNTILAPRANLLTLPQPTSGPGERGYFNFRFFNNLFAVQGFNIQESWRGSSMEFHRNVEAFTDPAEAHRGLAAGRDGWRAASLELDAGFALPADSRFRNASPIRAGELDAAPDPGAVPHGFTWLTAAGVGKGAERFSAFQQAVRYLPEPIRTMGTEPGVWGVYRLEGVQTVSLPPPDTSLRLTLRFPGEAAEQPLLDLPGTFNLSVKNHTLTIRIPGGAATAEIPPASPAWWRVLALDWTGGRLAAVAVDGRAVPLSKELVIAPVTGPAAVSIARLPLLDVGTTAGIVD